MRRKLPSVVKKCYMLCIKYTEQFDFEYDIQGIIRSFLPGEEMHTWKSGEDSPMQDLGQSMVLECAFGEHQMKMSLYADDVCVEAVEFERIYNENEYDRKETKNLLKRKLYDIFRNYTKKELPWGTLSGIRPTKITSALVEEGMAKEDIISHMEHTYYLSEKKAEECLTISENEKKILDKIDYKSGYSIYIGIPFCPSTCLYCSFTSYPVSRYAKKIDKYLDALFQEIEYCATALPDKKVSTIYIGGGTPTSLSAEQLDRLLAKISETFDTKSLHEFTIEAGRPDSITREKLQVIRKYDITRISINPQTMKDETLKIIGRHHNVQQFLDAYAMAREEGFDNINMDFILGLPGESIDDVRQSMEWVEQLRPDSLTIHSLAVKRAARLNLEASAVRHLYKGYRMENSKEIMQITKDTAGKIGLIPYYLYRQKNMTGNLENIGYARDTKEGIYNILIMEEKQTILAVGAGASSKMVHIDTDRIDRIENVKDVDLYIEKIDEMIERKRKYITEHFMSKA